MGLETESAWQAVVSAALVGSDRQPFQPPSIPGPLGQALAQLNNQPAESALLLAASTLSLYRRIGWLPANHSSLALEPCPLDDQPPCNLQATRFLQQMLLKREAAVLPEWLKTVAKSGQRIPDADLPTLLELGQKKRDLRSYIVPVLGQRGQWLAAQNPDWHYALPVTAADWETGNLEARVAYLEQLRSHSPDQARDLLSASWSQESANDAAKLLEALRQGLSMADELFLEEKLGDRRKKIRHAAARLLTYLPDSRLGQRMGERIKPLITLQQEDGVVQVIEVTLPESCDAAMERDGIEPKPPEQIGERAWWLLQILEATPLHYWEQHWHLSDRAAVETLLLQIPDHEWRRSLYNGWLRATQRQRNLSWSLAWLTDFDTPRQGVIDTRDLRLLLDNLTWEQRQQWVCEGYPSPRAKCLMPLVLAEDREPWSDELSRYVLENVMQSLNSKEGSTWFTFDLLKAAALCIAPSFLPQVTEICSQLQPEVTHYDYYLKEVTSFLATLQFRQEMLQAFQEKQG